LAVAGDPLGGFPAFQGSSSSTRPGFPTGPGGFPADPKGFQPTFKAGSRNTVSSSSSSSSRSRISRGVVTNYVGRPQPQDAAGSNREIIYRNDEEELFLANEGRFRT